MYISDLNDPTSATSEYIPMFIVCQKYEPPELY